MFILLCAQRPSLHISDVITDIHRSAKIPSVAEKEHCFSETLRVSVVKNSLAELQHRINQVVKTIDPAAEQDKDKSDH